MEHPECQQATPKEGTPMIFGWGEKLASMDPKWATYGPNTANWGPKNGQATYQLINKRTC